MTHEIQISKNTFINTTIRRRVPLHGVEFDEDFLAELVAKHLREKTSAGRPTMQTAYEIYMAENHSSHRRKFQSNANLYFNNFIELFGDLPLDELRHSHITKYRDHQLARGLSPISVRKHNNVLNAMINGFQTLGHRSPQSIARIADSWRKRAPQNNSDHYPHTIKQRPASEPDHCLEYH